MILRSAIIKLKKGLGPILDGCHHIEALNSCGYANSTAWKILYEHGIMLKLYSRMRMFKKQNQTDLEFPPAATTAAVRGRIAVPAFPRKS